MHEMHVSLLPGTGFQIPAAAAEALHPLSQVPGMGLPGIQVNPAQQVPAPAPTMNLQESLQAAQLQAQQSAQALAAASAVTAQQVCTLLSKSTFHASDISFLFHFNKILLICGYAAILVTTIHFK